MGKLKRGRLDMLLLFSGEGATDIGHAHYGHNGLCAPGEWEPGPMAHLAGELFQYIQKSDYPWAENAYFIGERALSELNKKFKPSLLGEDKSHIHSKMARTMGCVARHLAAQHHKKVIPIFFRDGSGSGKFSDREFNEVRASINEEKRGFRQLDIQTGVAMVPRPVSEVWLLCALKNKYQSCERLEKLPATDVSNTCLSKDPKTMLAKCLAACKQNHSDLPDLIQSEQIDCAKIKMPSYDCFAEDMQRAVNICAQGNWCNQLPKALQVRCDQAIQSCPALF